MNELLAKKLKDLPTKPGVYLYKDENGLLLYVGKAVNLRSRVSSYFKPRPADPYSGRITSMIGQIRDLEYVVTDNEVESLVLENNFIKQFHPKYNVRMRDDKNYLFIKINVQDEIPTISYEHKILERKARYFGPYTSSQSARDTLRMLRNIFPYCANVKVGEKPCFYYHIQKCPGVCFGKITLEEYRKNYINKIIGFLEGRQTDILKELQGQMKFLARHKQFERAAKVRNQIYALNRVLEKQKLVYPKKCDQDVFSLHPEPTMAVINLFRIREGKLIQRENFIIENTKQVSEAEIFESFLSKYYLDATSLAQEILLPVKIKEESLLPLLNERAAQLNYKKKIKFTTPTLGTKKDLIKMGRENARQYLESQTDKTLLEEARLLAALKELQRVLKLEQLPGRMECFDISNIQGTNAVGSMVVFDYARPKKEEYRKFKINKKDTPDDFGMMREMLERRFKRSLLPDSNNSIPDSVPESKKWPLPDLIIIDGGKGQLSTAVSVLRQYKLNIPIIGLAKRLEEIFFPGNSIPIILPHNSIALYLLQRIRDEAHRFAITYHRKLRSKGSLSSALDGIDGIGPAKKKRLLEKFGSVSNIKKASLTDIRAIVGVKLAEKIKASL